ncbi:MAG: DUF368 domain-containing protein, partial [Pseudomonadales bacterium]|nr:DUF368 domain-containing protein [Pseudomonadales bacterium]
IYEELIDSIGSVNGNTLKLLLTGKISQAWREINGTFLALVFGGILVSVISLAKIISWILFTHPKMIWAYFFGLILASVIYIGRQVKVTDWRNFLMFCIGAVVAYYLTGMSTVQVTPTSLTVFFAGAVAICAMILPGISGSFILVILGMYQPIINALKDFNVGVLSFFVLGCVAGLLSFTHLLSWLLHRYHGMMLALLTGFMLGSLNKVWPWKQAMDIAGRIQERNLWPSEYHALSQTDPQLILVLLMLSFGVVTVYAINVMSNTRSS